MKKRLPGAGGLSATIVPCVGPDRRTHVRNIVIVLALATAVWLLPGGGTGTQTIYNLLTVILTAGLMFFGYRLYMEHRSTLFGLDDRMRALLYGSLALAALAIVGTTRLWDQGGLGALVWFCLIGLAVWGVYRVWRAYRTY